MNRQKPDYNRLDFVSALRESGLKKRDVVFSHSAIGFLGVPEGGAFAENIFETVFGAFMDVIGDEGTLVVPTFTYSPGKNEVFDPEKTPSTVGALTEMIRKLPHAHRSLDPIFSVAAVGRLASELTHNVSKECFGFGSFWQRFLEVDGVICNISRDAGSTFLHYGEKVLHVPYRFDKRIPSRVFVDGQTVNFDIINFCWNRAHPESRAYFNLFDQKARKKGAAKSFSIGRGAIVTISARDSLDILAQGLNENPCFLTRAAEAGKSAFSDVCLRDAARLQVSG